MGQHFLIDGGVLERIVDALAPEADDTVLEVGAGIGTLTGALSSRAGHVVAIDIDARCVDAARITQRSHPNVRVERADAASVDPRDLGVEPPFLSAGNLPYHLTGPILGHLFELAEPPVRGVFLVQREVAARLSAVDGEWSLATVALRTIATVERLFDVPPTAFEPPPAVFSSLIRMTPDAAVTGEERRAIIALAGPVFQQRRKTLPHGLGHALGGDTAAARAALLAAGIEPTRRPGTLGLDEWRRLARAVVRSARDE